VDPATQPSFTDLVSTLNNRLREDNKFSHVRVVGVKWMAASNLLIRTQAPSPNELVAAWRCPSWGVSLTSSPT
jgi:hypothetical protein